MMIRYFGEADVSTVRYRARAYLRGEHVYALRDFHALDGDLRDRFESFVRFLRDEEVELTFFVAPYHPVVYEFLVASPKYRIIIAAQEYFRELARRESIPFHGSYDPSRLGLGEADFLDGMHARNETVARILRGTTRPR